MTKDQNIEKYVTQCMQYARKTSLPKEYDWRCVACGYNVIKRKSQLTKIQQKEISFANRLKYAGKR